MERREFLRWSATTFAALGLPPALLHAVPAGDASAFDAYATALLEGFVRNARRTAPGYAVCDYPDGTIVGGCITPSGKSYVSTARILPLLAEWLAAGKSSVVRVEGETVDLEEVAVEIFRNAFDPTFPHFWGKPPPDKKTQRSVEAALVADGLWRMRERVLPRLTSRERSNVQEWLASCTSVPERENNHAWFHCINQTVRLQLARDWPEFSGDEEWMKADLAAMHSLLPPGDDGWYSDSPKIPIYDYYNFWTFANFPLLWSSIAGTRYPEWSSRFEKSVGDFLRTAPNFFAADGSHPWFGRSLIYRWAVLSPLILAYRQGLWPHSPGLLRRIVRLNLAYHWGLGAFDAERGKLRESLSAEGTPSIRESYIDNGHPYWCTLGMLLYAIPADDPFWTAAEEPLPVERGDYVVRFEGPRMLVAGTRDSGQVRWLQARNTPKFPSYRDKYVKFVASSHFPYNILEDEKYVPWDQALVLRSLTSGVSATRTAVVEGELLEDGVRTLWSTELDGRKIEVESRIRLLGDFDERTHEVRLPAGMEVEVLDGSHALGLATDEVPEVRGGPRWQSLRSPLRGHLVASWAVGGFDRIERTEWFDEARTTRVNLVHPRMVVGTLLGTAKGRARFSSLHYASPRPFSEPELLRRATALLNAR
jgi:hypothetical protein